MYTLIDLRGFVMRSYFSGKDPDSVIDKETGKEINTAEYGFEIFVERYLGEWLASYPPHTILFTAEGGNTFRSNLYPEYKQGRGAEQSNAVKSQLSKLQDRVHELLLNMGLTICKQPGAEADDLLAYLAVKLKQPCLIHTVDQDLAALAALQDVTVVYHSVKNGAQYYQGDIDGMPAGLLTVKKSLVGDPSDNYKGVPGFGPKAWDTLVDRYGYDGVRELQRYVKTNSYEELAKDVEDTEDPLLSKIYDNRDKWRESYQLSKLYPALCDSVRGRKMYSVEYNKRVPKSQDFETLLRLFRGNDSGLLNTLKHLKPEFILVTQENLEECFQRFKKLASESPIIAWDYETYDPVQHQPFREASNNKYFVDVLSQEVTGCSFAVGKMNTKVFYVSCNHADTDNVDKEVIKDWLVVAEESAKTVAQNSQFEAAVSRTNFDYEVKSMVDTAMFAKNLYEHDSSSLKKLSKAHLGYEQATYQDTVGDKGSMAELTGAEVLDYGCDDSLVTASLYHLFALQSTLEGTKEFIEEYDCGSLHLLTDSFVKGFECNMEALNQMSAEDAKTESESLSTIRSLLAEHCSLPNEKAASKLYSAEVSFHRRKMREAGKSKEVIDKRLAEIKEEMLAGSIYTEPYEVRDEVEFKPTVAQINKVLGFIDVPFTISSVSSKALTGFMVDCCSIHKCKHKFLEDLAACIGSPLKERSGEAYEQLEATAKEILSDHAPKRTHGTELNFDSPKQMQLILYSMLDLPIRTRSKVTKDSFRDKQDLDGSPSTNENAIKIAMAEDCGGDSEWKKEVLENIIKVNKCRTRRKFYWTPYPKWVHPRDGKIHASINQSATVTNRPTGSSPNLLQVSKKDDVKVRSIIAAGKDMVMVSIDFSGQELRITADETKDPVFMSAYLGDDPKDIHTLTACAIGKTIMERFYKGINVGSLKWDGQFINYDFFSAVRDADEKGDPIFKAFERIRAYAKTLNFGVIYGAGAGTISTQLMIPRDVAEKLVEALFAQYKRLPEWKEEVWAFARKHGYVETVYGSRSHCWPDIISRDNNLRSRKERQVANFKIQGTAADILKIVMTTAYKQDVFKDTGAVLLAPVYDEVAARVPAAAAVEYINRMSEIMTITPPGYQISQIPEVSIGVENWGHQVELKAYPSEEKILGAINKLKAA